jgi:hypothetical protein
MNTWSSPSGPESHRRRSQRVMLSVPVTLTGRTPEGPFSEDTQTLVINAHGALVCMKTKVAKGQKMRIRTRLSPDEQDCQVIWIGPSTEGKTQCGIEFAKPTPHFWRITFPPADWTPASAGVLAESKKSKL